MVVLTRKLVSFWQKKNKVLLPFDYMPKSTLPLSIEDLSRNEHNVFFPNVYRKIVLRQWQFRATKLIRKNRSIIDKFQTFTLISNTFNDASNSKRTHFLFRFDFVVCIVIGQMETIIYQSEYRTNIRFRGKIERNILWYSNQYKSFYVDFAKNARFKDLYALLRQKYYRHPIAKCNLIISILHKWIYRDHMA